MQEIVAGDSHPPGLRPNGHLPFSEGGREPPTKPQAKALLARARPAVPRRHARAQLSRKRSRPPTALGFPVALKALGIAHKSEAGAVKLNLRDATAVRAARRPPCRPLGTGLYVERMVEGGVAELIVGITRDPLFGPVMTVGSGGVLVELLKDSATLLLPATRDEIEARCAG